MSFDQIVDDVRNIIKRLIDEDIKLEVKNSKTRY